MNPSPERTLLEFIRYNNWANWQLLQACLELGDDPLDAAIPGAYGTIRETLGHILRAEAYYVDLLTEVVARSLRSAGRTGRIWIR